ncbi:hypothetical protein P4631_08990 [Halalkalibacterium halodurans]|uniref:hypothetical protein n=1 Tax=Halalkalibacterium halodurans TaxID=86665 RepID=UPI002E212167|nr:hypothetical protein [Halalkalibacterium halodurans]
MPIYTPKFSEQPFRGGKNILASEHLQFIEAGATLDAQAFGEGYVEIGTAIMRDQSTGKYVPYADDTSGVEPTVPQGFDNFGILNVDWECDGENDGVVGEVIVRGSVYAAKLPDNVTDVFKANTPLIRYVDHIEG